MVIIHFIQLCLTFLLQCRQVNKHEFCTFTENTIFSNKLTEMPIFLASVESVIFAKGLSAPQHSTYFVILLDGRDLVGTPGVAENLIPTF